MKRQALFLVGISVLILSFGAHREDDATEKYISDIENSMVLVRGGDFRFKDSVVPIDSFFISKFEISNWQYRVFLDSLRRVPHRKKEYEMSVIDSTGWQRDKAAFCEPCVDYYHRHPAYDNYSVVNINYEGAVLFCEWMSKTYNSFLKRKYKKVMFYLPTENEWMVAASGWEYRVGGQKCVIRGEKQIFAWDDVSIYDEKGFPRGNLRIPEEFSKWPVNFPKEYTGGKKYKSDYPGSDWKWILDPVNYYKPTSIGLYCMHGNAAEMTNINGIAKGGSWANYPKESYVAAKQNYEGANPRTGFRLFMKVIEN